MKDLTKLARGEPCQIRAPSYCNGNPDTSVWCHLRLIGISGAGLKSTDVLGAIGCNSCHDLVDGRTHTDLSYDQRRLLLLEGIARTQVILIRRGLLKW